MTHDGSRSERSAASRRSEPRLYRPNLLDHLVPAQPPKVEVTPVNKSAALELKFSRAVKRLFEECLHQYKQVTKAFRKFDRRGKGRVSFSDFTFGIEQMGLQFDREICQLIFNYLDRDHDSALLYSDFVAMGQEASAGFISMPQ